MNPSAINGPPDLWQLEIRVLEIDRSSYRRGRPPEAVGRCLGFRCAGLAEPLPA